MCLEITYIYIYIYIYKGFVIKLPTIVDKPEITTK